MLLQLIIIFVKTDHATSVTYSRTAKGKSSVIEIVRISKNKLSFISNIFYRPKIEASDIEYHSLPSSIWSTYKT